MSGGRKSDISDSVLQEIVHIATCNKYQCIGWCLTLCPTNRYARVCGLKFQIMRHESKDPEAKME